MAWETRKRDSGGIRGQEWQSDLYIFIFYTFFTLHIFIFWFVNHVNIFPIQKINFVDILVCYFSPVFFGLKGFCLKKKIPLLSFLVRSREGICLGVISAMFNWKSILFYNYSFKMNHIWQSSLKIFLKI